MKNQKRIKNKILTVTVGSILSIVSVPSANSVSTAAITTIFMMPILAHAEYEVDDAPTKVNGKWGYGVRNYDNASNGRPVSHWPLKKDAQKEADRLNGKDKKKKGKEKADKEEEESEVFLGGSPGEQGSGSSGFPR